MTSPPSDSIRSKLAIQVHANRPPAHYVYPSIRVPTACLISSYIPSLFFPFLSPLTTTVLA
ncbi:hypothetical protein B9Z19DRAFT_715459 [Tuber borchii]|uniref:Uncharacterized protein n=1 Tax=Tuber borchii TaxID=42251 RepID=A0A2T6Z9V8_TUBBO|nr:hypothetical protein B9Z19DRAFT_715459 [Tuber borchii]